MQAYLQVLFKPYVFGKANGTSTGQFQFHSDISTV
jgi:hypothetical protein